MALVVLEFSLAFWIVSGYRRSIALPVATCTFTVFAGYTTAKWLAGHQQCDCFGDLFVPMYSVAILDWSIALLLFTFAIERFNKLAFSAICRIRIAAAILLLCGFASLFVAFPTAFNGIVVINPENWVGDLFPYLSVVSEVPVRESTFFAPRRVLVVKTGCPTCDQLLSVLALSAHDPPVAVLDLDDQAVVNLFGTLIVPIPLVVNLDNFGEVTSVESEVTRVFQLLSLENMDELCVQ